VGSHDYSFNVKPRWPLDAIDTIDAIDVMR
jgi:hypothetical protein